VLAAQTGEKGDLKRKRGGWRDDAKESGSPKIKKRKNSIGTHPARGQTRQGWYILSMPGHKREKYVGEKNINAPFRVRGKGMKDKEKTYVSHQCTKSHP